MPVVAVGVAIAADVAAGAAVLGTAGGIAAISLTTALEVVTAVGATIGAIGAVTGNKTLSMVGAGLGLVGGIGALASSAGILGADAASGASLFGPSTAATAADTAASTSSDAINTLAGTAGDVGGATSSADAAGGFDAVGASNAAADAASPAAALGTVPPPGPGGQSGDLTLMSQTSDAVPTASTTATGTAAEETPAASTTAAETMAPDANAVTQMPPSPVTPAAGGVTGEPTGMINATGTVPTSDAVTTQLMQATQGPTGGAGLIQSPSGLLQSLLKFGQKNPMLSYGVLQAGGQFLSGLTSPLTPAQVNALNAQANANQAAANLTTQQTQNLAQPRSTAVLRPVTGTPTPIVAAPQAGIINTAPPVNVTGAPT